MRERLASLRPPVSDIVVAAALLLLGLLEAWFIVDLKPGVATVGILIVGSVLAWRRKAPMATAIIATGAEFTTAQLGVPVDSHVFVIPALVLALYSLGAHATPRRAALGLIVSLLFVAASVFAEDGPGIENLGFSVVVAGAPWLAGRLVRRRTDHAVELALHAQELERTQDERQRAAVALERARIARELHDIVAHSVSVMTIQAGAIEQVLDRDPDKARAAAESIRQTGRHALTDLRRLLGLLRDDVPSSEVLAPQPGLEELKSLVDQVRLTGLVVDLDVEGEQRPLPPAIDLSAFRVVQEALTNMLKHSEASVATVRVRFTSDLLEIEVTDDGIGGEGVSSGGHGLVGMRERIALYGGQLEYGSHPGGGFRVYATLPLTGVPE